MLKSLCEKYYLFEIIKSLRQNFKIYCLQDEMNDDIQKCIIELIKVYKSIGWEIIEIDRLLEI